ncbi:hypothetical protein TREES_T100007277 [Tupaia chinensis]|uniref:Uncharacterized protein n=1 Tax=Tupaia chinensis TaxID=246437 RepID=L9L076_TUPCH|nr:hypothetical protein TREES_T100007277 [Tupaia chinensis]
MVLGRLGTLVYRFRPRSQRRNFSLRRNLSKSQPLLCIVGQQNGPLAMPRDTGQLGSPLRAPRSAPGDPPRLRHKPGSFLSWTAGVKLLHDYLCKLSLQTVPTDSNWVSTHLALLGTPGWTSLTLTYTAGTITVSTSQSSQKIASIGKARKRCSLRRTRPRSPDCFEGDGGNSSSEVLG